MRALPLAPDPPHGLALPALSRAAGRDTDRAVRSWIIMRVRARYRFRRECELSARVEVKRREVWLGAQRRRGTLQNCRSHRVIHHAETFVCAGVVHRDVPPLHGNCTDHGCLHSHAHYITGIRAFQTNVNTRNLHLRPTALPESLTLRLPTLIGCQKGHGRSHDPLQNERLTHEQAPWAYPPASILIGRRFSRASRPLPSPSSCAE